MRYLIPAIAVMMIVLVFSVSAFAKKENAPLTVEGAIHVSPEEAKVLFDEGILFVDVREDAAWELGRIPGAVHLDVKMDDIFNKDALMEEAGLDEKILFYCNGVKCGRASSASKKAVEYGYKHIYYYREGFPGWKNAGYPVE